MLRCTLMGLGIGVSTACLLACSSAEPTNQRDLVPSGTGAVQETGGGSGGAPLTSGGTVPPNTGGLNLGVGGSLVNTTGGDNTNLPDLVTVAACETGERPAGISDAEVATLRAGGAGAASRMLYPYDGTVFPRGMLAPTFMWEGPEVTAVHVRLRAARLDAEFCAVPTGPGQLVLDQGLWNVAGKVSQGAASPYQVEVTVLSGGQAIGPMKFEIVVAQATMKGSIFYNSYSSRFALAGGAVLRIPAGREVEPFTSTECNGCHSVSADGSRLIAQTLLTGGRSFALTPGIAAQPAPISSPARTAYGALYPDGSHFLTTSTEVEVARTALTSTAVGYTAAKLFATDSGAEVPATGIPSGALMPMFSPDGRHLAFTDYAVGTGKGLVVMNYETGSHTASNYRVLFEDSANTRPSWPFFLPDNGGLVMARTASADFTGDAAGLIGGVPLGSYSELSVVDIATGTSTLLAQAMGYRTVADAAAGTTYLPFGAEEVGKNYFPTVSPVAAGGYFWVFFDAVRHYGNLGSQRQLWGTAVDIAADGSYVVDGSHPAFYIPGQEFGTGNHRAFAALDPCRGDGDGCSSGIDCCGGFCKVTDGAVDEFGEPIGQCSSAPPACSNRDDACKTVADCCAPGLDEPSLSCIGGFCAVLTLE